MQLRPYQQQAVDAIKREWGQGVKNLLLVLPTGSGKTVIFAYILSLYNTPRIAIAHRHELLAQISCALAGYGVYHRLICAQSTLRHIASLHARKFGCTYIRTNANCYVASVDTLIRREIPGCEKMTHWVQDEAHHILQKNKWGKATAMFPNALGLGVTATPRRADGAGLSRDTDGVIDQMIQGPQMRELVDMGYLTDYRIYAPPATLDLTKVDTSKATGDYKKPQLCAAVRESTVMGDIVDHYIKLANGKLGITFMTDVQSAGIVAEKFRNNGIPAEVVSHKTPDSTRHKILEKFKQREILQLVNVDLFGEGFDLPAIEVVSFGRPTQSYAVYVQQFGRALRPMPGKSHAIIIDHVGNVIRHGLPDGHVSWSLDRRVRKQTRDPNVIPLRICPECTSPYERIHRACPFCGFYTEPTSRMAPAEVDGDLCELTPQVLDLLRGKIAKVDIGADEYRQQLIRKGCPTIGVGRNVRAHTTNQQAQKYLREQIAVYGAKERTAGSPDSQSYRKFYFRYGVDVLTAQTLASKEAMELGKRIEDDI